MTTALRVCEKIGDAPAWHHDPVVPGTNLMFWHGSDYDSEPTIGPDRALQD
jgi:hypothetical protein